MHVSQEKPNLSFVHVETPSRDERALLLVEALNQNLKSITGSSGSANAALTDFDDPDAMFLLAMRGDEAVGCGGFRPISKDVCELKRMFSVQSGCGIGKGLLHALEDRAAKRGYLQIWLETRRINERAVGFYMAHNYAKIENYGPYRGREDAVCFSKVLC